MQRRQLLVLMAGWPLLARAGLLDSLSNKDATGALRQALEQGASQAVATLGVADGFFGNERFRVPLPDGIKKIEKILRTFGQGKALDDLHLAMNRAAENAVSEAKPMLVDAVRKMSVQDAKGILGGGDDSVTQFFRGKTFDPLTQKFLPVVSKATARLRLAEQYNKLASRGIEFGLVKEEDANVERYVTRHALDALYLRIGEEEKAIRENPAQAVGSIARKVFSVLGRQ